MRIFLLPVTAQRSLIHCQRVGLAAARAKPRLDDRVASRVGQAWERFEKSDKKWKQTVVRWTGKLLDTIPFEEGGLKTVPPQSSRLRQRIDQFRHKQNNRTAPESSQEPTPVELVYPSTAYDEELDFGTAQRKVGHIARDAIKTHRKQMLMCVAGLPLTIPFAINPFFPNIPGFYLIYRLWSNYRAFRSAQHLQVLVDKKQFKGVRWPELDEAYSTSPIPMSAVLAKRVGEIVGDQVVDRELKRAIWQTSVLLPKNKPDR